MADGGEVVYALIANIPSFYHSADLRNYFSQFIESGGFSCFHFRHRPEGAAAETRSDGEGRGRDRPPKTLCCVVRLRRDQLEKLVKMYNRRHWLDRKGEPTAALCFISKLKVTRTTQGKRPLLSYGLSLSPNGNTLYLSQFPRLAAFSLSQFRPLLPYAVQTT